MHNESASRNNITPNTLTHLCQEDVVGFFI